MATQSGLRSTSEKQTNQVRRKDSRAQPRRARQSSVVLTPSASPVSTYSGPNSQVQDNRMGQIADALSGLNPTLELYGVQRTKAKENEQMEKIRFYAEQVMKDKETGAISKAQIKEIFPELVPTVAARVQQSVAELEARRWAEGKMEAVLQNDDLRLNTANREAYYQQMYSEAQELVGNEGIYASAFLETLDGQKNSWERQFQVETAAYHEEVQLDAFKGKVADALLTGDADSLLAIDDNFGNSSSLNNRERKEAVVQTALDMAFDHPSVLDNIPDRFLNKQYKTLIREKKRQIEDQRVSRRLRDIRLHNAEKSLMEANAIQDVAARVASGETDINIYKDYPQAEGAYSAMRAILNHVAAGQGIDPNDPGYKFQVDLEAESFKNTLFNAATYDAGESPLANDPVWQEVAVGDTMTKANLLKYLGKKVERGEMLPEVARKVMADADQVLEGFNFFNDPDVKTYYNETVGAALKDMSQNPKSEIAGVKGVNIRQSVYATFNSTFQRAVRDYQQDNNGSLPRGSDRTRLLHEAAAAAEQTLERKLSLETQDQETETPSPYPDDHPRAGTDMVWLEYPNGLRKRVSRKEAEALKEKWESEPETLPSGATFDDNDVPPHKQDKGSKPPKAEPVDYVTLPDGTRVPKDEYYPNGGE